MDLSRRGLVAGLGMAAAFGGASAALAKASDFKDLQAAVEKAIEAGGVLRLPEGDFATGGLRIRGDVLLAGVPGRTRIFNPAGGAVLVIEDAQRVTLSGLRFGGGTAATPGAGETSDLVSARAVAELVIEDCVFAATPLTALKLERCGGRICNNRFTDLEDAAIFALDSRGLTIAGNTLTNIGNNGILVWTSSPAEDGTRVTGNRIRKVGAKGGGSGENGNGINVFRAGAVLVADNRISDCAFSAVRNNSGAACQIVNNSCARLGEVAIYCEFAFEGAVVSGNIVEDCAHGISITNFDSGGRLAAVSANVIRRPGRTGISAEADTAVSGNVVQAAGGAGIALGWGPYARNLTASGNVLQACFRGIVFSMSEGAGPVSITGNRIDACTAEALLGMDHDTPMTGDLGRDGQAAPGRSVIANNLVS